jgi:hypothetical protein
MATRSRTASPFAPPLFRTIIIGLGIGIGAAGCFSMRVSPDLVRTKAASDLSCPAQNIQVEKVTDNNWKVIGCNQTVSYVCSESNSLSAGMCMREGTLAGGSVPHS